MALPIAKSTLSSDANLVNSYPLNGNANDVKGSANGTAVGVVYDTTGSPFNDGSSGADFSANNGVGTGMANAYINALFLAPGAGNFTYYCWAKFLSVGNQMSIIHNEANGASGRPAIDVYMTGSGTFGASASSTSGSLIGFTSTGVTPTVGVWYQVALVRSGSTWTLYINASSVGSASNSGTTIASSNGAIGFRYNNSYSTDYPMYGYISDVAIFSRALTNTELSYLYSGVIVPVTIFGSTFTVNPVTRSVMKSVTIFGSVFSVLTATPIETLPIWLDKAKSAISSFTNRPKL